MEDSSYVHSIIIPVENANITAHTYTEVYGGSAGCSININGNLLAIGASTSFEIWVRSVSGGTGCYLLGENKNVYQGSTDLSNDPTPTEEPTSNWLLGGGIWSDSGVWDDSSVWID